MRSPPPPALKNVMVARPGANPGVVARRDNLLTTAVFAAEESHEPRSSRPLSVLARVQRRVSRWGDSLRRRTRQERRVPRHLVQSHHVAFDRNGNAAQPPPAPPQSESTSSNLSDALASQVLLHRERILRMEREKKERDVTSLTFDDIDEDDHHDERAVSSLREPWSRRVRQVGAREDDDTLLMLPRLSSISFSAAGEPVAVEPAKVRQLPRLSGLMPTRASPRSPSSPVASGSPVSSTSRSASTASSGRKRAAKPQPVQTPDKHHPNPFAANSPHPAMYRLPTALNNRDVEREMQQAIVEVASEGGSEADTDSPRPRSPCERRIPGFNFDVTNGRVMSDVHHEMRIPRSQPFTRRANSSLYATTTESEEDEVDAHQQIDDSFEHVEERPFFSKP
ncbi:hypothetical protein BWQ96_09504 [Gracilariopsis chorda]|uniref:Uncharacterized protein n=1 Tax=Gracilariopsis chorda TaxID=448386 RepID=A0A2V3IFE0_9FLOR|nr:hypothetical protein BWQ96_09504 [Gracilariopsis chorda]|eukprot:PXF40794.1 hypothetical protein BWQ96_09504 [Gracilariopsis chorda]